MSTIFKLSITRTNHDTFNRVYIIPPAPPQKEIAIQRYPLQSSNTTSRAIQTRLLAKFPINPTRRLLNHLSISSQHQAQLMDLPNPQPKKEKVAYTSQTHLSTLFYHPPLPTLKGIKYNDDDDDVETDQGPRKRKGSMHFLCVFGVLSPSGRKVRLSLL